MRTNLILRQVKFFVPEEKGKGHGNRKKKDKCSVEDLQEGFLYKEQVCQLCESDRLFTPENNQRGKKTTDEQQRQAARKETH